jgi:hypothetical protein
MEKIIERKKHLDMTVLDIIYVPPKHKILFVGVVELNKDQF